ncbi:MAG: penicillin-binding protein activator [Burkholderiales bacterium]|nr:penicillin-binding protein activator [Burkholderiales bacterium]
MSSAILNKIYTFGFCLCLTTTGVAIAQQSSSIRITNNDISVRESISPPSSKINSSKIKVGLLTAPAGSAGESLVKPLKEGVKAAFEQDKNKYELVEYELTDPDQIIDTLNKAADEKVMLVIGPVLKSSVEKIATLPFLPLPVIAINRAESPVNPELFMSIDLTREGEVEQLVQVAMENTAKRSGGFVILTTDREYDTNLAKAISQELQKNGVASEIRNVGKGQLGTLKSDIQSHSYRGLFFATNTSQASSIRPYLPFDLPVFGTSYTNPASVLDPVSARTQASDLNGMVTLEVPAVTQMNGNLYLKYRTTLKQLRPEARRLFAVGVDAWNIGKDWIQWHTNINLETGLSGKIQFNRAQSSRVKRIMDKSVVKPGEGEYSLEGNAVEAGL